MTICTRSGIPPRGVTCSARVLVVDDDPAARDLMDDCLRAMGHAPEAAADGAAGWEMLEEGGFEMALVDLDMPRMGGLDLIARVRADARFAALPVIVVSGRSDTPSLRASYDGGAVLFVPKPVNWPLLRVQVDHALGLARLKAGGYIRRT